MSILRGPHDHHARTYKSDHLVWNHDALMREATEGLARRLDAELELMSSESRAGWPARTLAWACLLLVLLALVVARWRRRT